jgi:uncharacterized metal-binding protein
MVGATGVHHFIMSGDYFSAASWGIGTVLATVLQPDLDQCEGVQGYIGFGIMRETYHKLEKLWSMYWYLYARLFAHRSFWTHTPIIGTLGRMIYLFPYIVFIYKYLPMYFILALVTCDFLHWIMDWKGWGRVGMFRQ